MNKSFDERLKALEQRVITNNRRVYIVHEGDEWPVIKPDQHTIVFVVRTHSIESER